MRRFSIGFELETSSYQDKMLRLKTSQLQNVSGQNIQATNVPTTKPSDYRTSQPQNIPSLKHPNCKTSQKLNCPKPQTAQHKTSQIQKMPVIKRPKLENVSTYPEYIT